MVEDWGLVKALQFLVMPAMATLMGVLLLVEDTVRNPPPLGSLVLDGFPLVVESM
jgi:hypothetical protein